MDEYEPDGYGFAERLGLEAWRDARGDDGTAYWLEDGRMMKVTSSQGEVAIALALLDAQAAGLSHPSVPRVDDVRWTMADLELPDGTVHPVPRFVIVREDFADYRERRDDDDMYAIWAHALRHLDWGLRHGKPEHVAEALRVWEPHGEHVRQVLDGLEWIRRTTGARILDVRPSNVGQGPGGLGMRDLSRGEVPGHLLDRVARLDFARLPEAAPVLSPSP